MRAEFSIVTQTRENVMSIPRAAVQGDAAERFVYVKDYDLEDAFVKTQRRNGVSERSSSSR
jgi:cobalt-zinc-cadmium efflux system membrane fusion protein